MVSRGTVRLAILATLVHSILAGMNVNRALVEMPAWQQTGPLAWAAFSRHADLARNGAILYPLDAFAGVILSLAAVVGFRRDGSRPRAAGIPIYAAPLMSIAGLLTTVKAAPNMLRVPDLDNDQEALQRALDGFQFWGNIRGLFQFLAFVANLWSLVAITDPRSQARQG